MARGWQWLFGIAFANTSFGCAGSSELPKPSGTSAGSNLKGSELACGGESASIGWLTRKNWGCTATLVRDNVVLTASHCVLGTPWAGTRWELNPTGAELEPNFQFHVNFTNQKNQSCGTEKKYSAVRWITFTGGQGYFDLALVQIAPAASAWPFNFRTSEPAHDGSVEVSLYGRGQDNPGCTDVDFKLRVATLTYDTPHGGFSADPGYSFDLRTEYLGVKRPDLVNGSDDELLQAATQAGYLCHGDSGGPFMVKGTRAIMKVASGISPGITSDGTLSITEKWGDAVALHHALENAGAGGIDAIANALSDAPAGLSELEQTLEKYASSPYSTGGGPIGDLQSLGCGCGDGKDNFCSYAPSTPGCSMTFPGGYCDPNGDGSYADADWVKGYDDYAAACLAGASPSPSPSPAPAPTASSCPCVGDNFCTNPPSTPGCPMTFPGGYCDPNGDGSFTDGDWTQGYYDHAAACG